MLGNGVEEEVRGHVTGDVIGASVAHTFNRLATLQCAINIFMSE